MTEWQWMALASPVQPTLHLVAAWTPSTGRADRYETACGKSTTPVVIIEGDRRYCACCLHRVIVDGR